MKRKYPALVLSFIFISTAMLFQNCSQPAEDEGPMGSTATNNGNSSYGGMDIDPYADDSNTPSSTGGTTTWGGGTTSPTSSSTSTSTSNTSTSSAAVSNAVVISASPTQLKVRITVDSAHVGVFGAVYVGAFYKNTWYFWDATKNPANRWVATDVNASTYPEFASDKAPATFDIVITEMVAEAHGAKINVGLGFGKDAVTRRNDLVNTQRYKEIYTIP